LFVCHGGRFICRNTIAYIIETRNRIPRVSPALKWVDLGNPQLIYK
jgi:hypothetical protein